ncbi:MAG: hypothetical protein AAGA80_17375 [Cyanobacteria bacterium P01_F01_bin.143]
MNAIEQATNLKMISKIEAIVYLFKSKFPEAKADLKPWMQNANTKKYQDENSIDIGFHFPNLDFSCQCRSILMQVKFNQDFRQNKLKAIGIELSGFEHASPLWRLSTIADWQFEGGFPPTVRSQEKLKQICYRIINLFDDSEEIMGLSESKEES